MKPCGRCLQAWSARAASLRMPPSGNRAHASLIIAGLDVCTEEGINDKGLIVNLLFLDGTQYEARNSKRPGIAFFQWPQFYLDNYATVNEVIANLDQVQVVNTALGAEYPDGLPLHVAIADTSGQSAIIEFIKGEPVVHLGRQYQVMTNEPAYDQQIANMLRYKTFGGTVTELPGGIQADDRFVRAAYSLKYLPKTSDPAQAAASMMSLMNNVSVPFGSPYSGVSGTYPDLVPFDHGSRQSRLLRADDDHAQHLLGGDGQARDEARRAGAQAVDLRREAHGRSERRVQGSESLRLNLVST